MPTFTFVVRTTARITGVVAEPTPEGALSTMRRILSKAYGAEDSALVELRTVADEAAANNPELQLRRETRTRLEELMVLSRALAIVHEREPRLTGRWWNFRQRLAQVREWVVEPTDQPQR